MAKLLEEIKFDLRFIGSYSLQPQWYKVLQVFILVGFLLGYAYFFGWVKTAVFFAGFIFLGLLVHLLYRAKTNKWKQSWLDFVVVEQDGQTTPNSIGKFHDLAIVLNTILSLVFSQVLP